MIKIHQINQNISLFFSKKFFKERLPISYVVFNKLFRKFILNRNSESQEMKKFHKDGFVKLEINLKDVINKFKDKIKLNKHNPEDKKIWFYLEPKDKEELEKNILTCLNKKILDIGNYFNSDINFANMRMYRILHSENSDKEIYADRFHQDGYLITYIKIHINMMDVGHNDGPMNIISIKNKKKFFDLSNYKDRADYNKSFDNKIVHRNTGQKGDCFLFSSPQCFHRAEIPGKFRDMMQLIFVATPRKFNLKELDKIQFKKNEENHKLILFSKPYTSFSIFNTFLSFLNAKNKNKQILKN